MAILFTTLDLKHSPHHNIIDTFSRKFQFFSIFQIMQRIKIKYTKGKEIKFISHRDLMRVFIRAIRRAELPIAYSQGFNPHMKISWGQALKLGKTSEEEYATLQFDGWVKPQTVMEKLNQQLPPGIEILESSVI